ncbi:related to dienelactone hydrolase and related enzymes [Cephalotrichum gorgonifer]|uniref:Related to dienelactone hydrolase and related enzymes n=1 Tax=Cephalotrichum gorgonifer TaxID=2041049 RepID=A0AAE8SV31_9PEZI|nr:related to dienelactone hydrolase and related enzymes [Cephalotrichum gorgonifer]
MEDATPAPLPSALLQDLAPNATLQPPLSRRGHGPGLVVFDPGYVFIPEPSAEGGSGTLDPMPQYKWAEEGYAVARISFGGELTDVMGEDWGTAEIGAAIQALRGLEECDTKDKFGILVYGSPAEYPLSFNDAFSSALIANGAVITAVVVYSDKWDLPTPLPLLTHVAGPAPRAPRESEAAAPNAKTYEYPNASSADFVIPGAAGFSYAAASVAHSRSLGFVKERLGGPYFDLEAIWEEHTYYEFGDRSLESTMGTMVLEPYVNDIPTMTGGIGRERLTNFYRHHFIWSNPDDSALELVSRTIGVDRIVDEFIFTFTHSKEVDWMIPGIPPTGITLRVPFVSVVNVRGDRLYHEHISWDQATVLRQLGLMPEWLPFPHPVAGREGQTLQYRVPVAGADTARKLQDLASVESNQMLEPGWGGVREVRRV